MEKEMDVRVDQPRHKRGIAEINYFRAGRMRYRGTGFRDALAAHQNFSRLDDPASFNIQQARGMKDDRTRRRLRLASN
jgi:hypothetical protein